MIQIIQYDAEKAKAENGLHVNSFSNPHSFDDYFANIIDLRDKEIWCNDGHSSDEIKCKDDLFSLSILIEEAKSDCNIVIVLPQNETMYYGTGYCAEKPLKDMTIQLCRSILGNLYHAFFHIELIFANTMTLLECEEVGASFYFRKDEGQEVLTKTIKSTQATTIRIDKVILTTLNLHNHYLRKSFLREVGILPKEKMSTPEWLKEIKMFDDTTQLDIVCKNKSIIEEAKSNISAAEAILVKNSRLKSILYVNGDELIEVVFEILEDMLGIDLSKFEDTKKEDFLFELGDLLFLGEVKGISDNVKGANISQLENHFRTYLDNHAEVDEERVRCLLIINYLRKKPITERDPVDEKQVILAKRNESMIIDTHTFLKLYEKYKKGEYTREDCISLLSDTTPGILEIK